MSLEWRGAPVEPGSGRPDPDWWRDVSVPGRPAEFAGDDAVAYMANFVDPREGDDEHVVLELDGMYAHARVWLNGDPVAEHDAYFEPLRLPLDVETNNELIVVCRRPDDRFGGIHETDQVPADLCVPGIWWAASLETYPDPYIESLEAIPRLDGVGEDNEGSVEAAVEVSASVVTRTATDDRITFSLRPESGAGGGGTMSRARVETGPGRTTVTDRIEVRDPSLWWPHDLGTQSYYSVRAKLDGVDRTAPTALRSVEYGDDGLVVNGRRVAACGVNLIAGEAADAERAVEANANLVRGHAHVLAPDVYEACDEHGVLVWQDLPLTGPGSFDVDRARDLAERLVAARRHHPSFGALTVHDEPVPDFADGLGSGLLDRYRYRFRAWRASYDADPAEAVASGVEEVPTFPVVGPTGVDHDATAMYPGWAFGDAGDVGWLCDHYDVGDVVGEFGAGALASETSPETPAETPDFDAERHAAVVGTDPSESQAHQAAVVGRVAETLRRRGANVLAAYALRDVGDAGMGILARDGTPKTAFDRLASAYEPVQVVLSDPTPGESDVVAIHDRPKHASVTVEWDVDGDREQAQVEVGPYDRQIVETLSLSDGDEVTLAVAVDGSVTKNEYAL